MQYKDVPFLLASFKTFHLTEGYKPEEFHFIGLRSQKNREGKEIEMPLLKTTVRIQFLAGLDTILILTVKKNCQEIFVFSVIWKFSLKLLQ